LNDLFFVISHTTINNIKLHFHINVNLGCNIISGAKMLEKNYIVNFRF
jgi:hypothetical protein